MKKRIRHISPILILLVAYSLLFQNIHVLFHDHGRNQNQCNTGQTGTTNFCASGTVCGHSSGSINKDENPDHQKQHGINNPDLPYGESGHCPVCEYEFYKFRISKIITVCFSSETIGFINPCPYQTPPIQYNGNDISLRAPPSFFKTC